MLEENSNSGELDVSLSAPLFPLSLSCTVLVALVYVQHPPELLCSSGFVFVQNPPFAPALPMSSLLEMCDLSVTLRPFPLLQLLESGDLSTEQNRIFSSLRQEAEESQAARHPWRDPPGR